MPDNGDVNMATSSGPQPFDTNTTSGIPGTTRWFASRAGSEALMREHSYATSTRGKCGPGRLCPGELDVIIDSQVPDCTVRVDSRINTAQWTTDKHWETLVGLRDWPGEVQDARASVDYVLAC